MNHHLPIKVRKMNSAQRSEHYRNLCNCNTTDDELNSFLECKAL